jgi:hypothetical protein
MSDTIVLRFARKPCHMGDVKSASSDRSAHRYEVAVTETKQLTTAEYDYFITTFLRDRDWLRGKGGFKDELRQAVEVTAPERETLYIDPSGSAYARYVAMVAPPQEPKRQPPLTEQERFEHFVQELTTISRKHGVAVMSMGGVFILDDDDAAKRIAYSCDANRGNLEFNLS